MKNEDRLFTVLGTLIVLVLLTLVSGVAALVWRIVLEF